MAVSQKIFNQEYINKINKDHINKVNNYSATNELIWTKETNKTPLQAKGPKAFYFFVQINGLPYEIKLDEGSTNTTMGIRHFKELKTKTKLKYKYKPAIANTVGSQVKLLGKATVDIKINNHLFENIKIDILSKDFDYIIFSNKLQKQLGILKDNDQELILIHNQPITNQRKLTSKQKLPGYSVSTAVHSSEIISDLSTRPGTLVPDLLAKRYSPAEHNAVARKREKAPNHSKYLPNSQDLNYHEDRLLQKEKAQSFRTNYSPNNKDELDQVTKQSIELFAKIKKQKQHYHTPEKREGINHDYSPIQALTTQPAPDNNLYNIFLRQCILNQKRMKYIGVTTDGTAEHIINAVIKTGSNIIQTFMTYTPTEQSYSDEMMKNWITLKEGKPNLTNDYKLIKALEGYNNDVPQLKIVIHASMGLSINDNFRQYNGNINWKVTRIIQEIKRAKQIGSKVYVLHVGTSNNTGNESRDKQQIKLNLEEILKQTQDTQVMVLLENSASNKCYGAQIDELIKIKKSIKKELQEFKDEKGNVQPR
ncbi:10159_t:CDS:2, partial [Ambispora leptoticha]